jgi:hypothetical protein
MLKIRTLTVSFDTDIAAYELPAFRGAVISKAGTDHILFHNHLSDDQLLHRYPVIQYKRLSGRPAIFCLGEGVDEIHHFFNNRSWKINISNRDIDLKIHKLNMDQVTMQVWNHFFHYEIRQWIALNAENLKRYKALESEPERFQLLEGILTGNIISMAKSIRWDINKQIVVRIHEIQRQSIVKVKTTKLIAFDVKFQSNAFLPTYIGLGKSCSLGFGVVRPVGRNINTL